MSSHQRPLVRCTRRGFRSCWIRVLLKLWLLPQKPHRQMAARMATQTQTSTATRRKVTDKQIPLFNHVLIEMNTSECSLVCPSETVAPSPVSVPEPEPEVEVEPIPVVERPVRSRGKTPVTSRTRSSQLNRVRAKHLHYV